MFKEIFVKFSEGTWSEEVDFTALLNAIVDFVKKILKFEFKFDLDA